MVGKGVGQVMIPIVLRENFSYLVGKCIIPLIYSYLFFVLDNTMLTNQLLLKQMAIEILFPLECIFSVRP